MCLGTYEEVTEEEEKLSLSDDEEQVERGPFGGEQVEGEQIVKKQVERGQVEEKVEGEQTVKEQAEGEQIMKKQVEGKAPQEGGPQVSFYRVSIGILCTLVRNH